MERALLIIRLFRCFLKYDTREFLNVLSLSFEEQIFQSELGKRQKQRIVDILLQVMVEQGNFTVSLVYKIHVSISIFSLIVCYDSNIIANTSGNSIHIFSQTNG